DLGARRGAAAPDGHALAAEAHVPPGQELDAVRRPQLAGAVGEPGRRGGHRHPRRQQRHGGPGHPGLRRGGRQHRPLDARGDRRPQRRPHRAPREQEHGAERKGHGGPHGRPRHGAPRRGWVLRCGRESDERGGVPRV
ncbi:MAG: hypothetical protein AVDCRST_MAG54-2876, partial [uncultured Actinomycetospora sp.]